MSASDRYRNLAPVFAWQVDVPAGTVAYTDDVTTGAAEALAAGTRYGYDSPSALTLALTSDPVRTGGVLTPLEDAVLASSDSRLSSTGVGIDWTPTGRTRSIVWGIASADRPGAVIEFDSAATAAFYGFSSAGPHTAIREDIGGGEWLIMWRGQSTPAGVWTPRGKDYGVSPVDRRNVAVRRSSFGAGSSVVRWTGRRWWVFSLLGVPWARVNARMRVDDAYADPADEDTAIEQNLYGHMIEAATHEREIRAWLYDRLAAEYPVQRLRLEDEQALIDSDRLIRQSRFRPNLVDIDPLRMRVIGQLDPPPSEV